MRLYPLHQRLLPVRLPDCVHVDGNQAPKIAYPVSTIVRGDARLEEIAAASILAKVSRDALMVEMHARYPNYGFAKHKGYPTKAHFAALQKMGACPEHRPDFAPVRRLGAL